MLVGKHILKQARKYRILFPMVSVKQNIEMGENAMCIDKGLKRNDPGGSC